jgi:O-acetyl-ADP-ribose deacetylase (regulator of RNase III)
MDYKQKNLIDALLEDEIDVLVHGCNCFNTMGAGIAKQIKFQFPEVYKLDCTTKKGDRSKLGTTNYIKYKRNYYHGKFYIVNCYTQFTY